MAKQSVLLGGRGSGRPKDKIKYGKRTGHYVQDYKTKSEANVKAGQLEEQGILAVVRKWYSRWVVYRAGTRKKEGKGTMSRKIKVTQIRKGKRVTFLTKDKGKPGKTPKREQWYEPGVETGWEKDMPQNERRDKVLGAHKGDELASARSMQALANVTTDRETARKARADALHFYGLHREIRRISRRQRAPRVTPKTPRLRR